MSFSGFYNLVLGSFLTASPLSLHPLASLMNECLNLPFGTQGRSRRLESVPYKQKNGVHGKFSLPRSPTGSCLVSKSGGEMRELEISGCP